jgi:hypothetical protein
MTPARRAKAKVMSACLSAEGKRYLSAKPTDHTNSKALVALAEIDISLCWP